MRDQSFPRKNRLTERDQFIRLFDKPGVHRSAAFQAFWKANDVGLARLGITIKGRLSGVWRIRVKRVIREWFRTRKEILGGNDINIVIRVPSKLDVEFTDALRDQLARWKS